VTISLFLFYGQHLYADAMQQVVYIVLLIAGWYNWTFRKHDDRSLAITRLSRTEAGIVIAAIVSIAISLGFVLDEHTDALFPWLDSFASSMAFAAQYLVARKKIENWLLWIPVNLIYIGIYIQKDMALYALLFTVYLALAVNGFLSWKVSFKKSTSGLT
jgi:nicotinamide mononucleotide transporter